MLFVASPALAVSTSGTLLFQSQGETTTGGLQITDPFRIRPEISASGGVEATIGPVTIIPAVTVIPELCIPEVGCTPAVRTPALVLGKTGLEAEAGIRFALESELDFSPGSLDVQVPINLALSVDQPVLAGQQYTVSSNLGLATGAGFTAGAPSLGFTLDGFLDASFGLGLHLFGADVLSTIGLSSPWVLDPPPVSIIDQPDISLGAPVSVTMSDPLHLVTESVTELGGYGASDIDILPDGLGFGLGPVDVPVPGFLLDWAGTVLDILGLPSDFLDERSLELAFSLLDLDLGMDLPFTQRLELLLGDQGTQLEGTLMVDGVPHAWTPGQDLTLTAPSVLDGDVELEAILDFSTVFKSRFSLGMQLDCQLKVLSADLTIPLGIPDVHVTAVDEDCSQNLIHDWDRDDMTLLATSFSIDSFESQSLSLTVPTSSLASVPEPSTGAMLFLGIVALSHARRSGKRAGERVPHFQARMRGAISNQTNKGGEK